MNNTELYKSRVMTAEEALSKIRSGDHIAVHHSTAEPYALMRELYKRTDLYGLIVTCGGTGMGEFAKPEYESIIRHNCVFANPSPFVNKAVAESRADFVPIYLSNLARYFSEYYPPDVTLLQVPPPDDNGYTSLSLGVDYTKAAVESTKRLVIAQVNPRMPYVSNEDALVHISKIHCFVEMETELIVIPPYTTPTEQEQDLCKNVASLVADGSCLQIGLGRLPDTVLSYLGDRNDLGIHSEVFSDGTVDLVRKGVITGKRKNIDTGKIVATFAAGTKKTFEFIDHNEMVLIRSLNYVNDPFVIAQNDNMVSINGCLQVDLLGQVASDALGDRQIAGVGGQVDFVRGAGRSKGGKSILVVPSTALNGTVSSIASVLAEGSVVTTNRYDVHYIVTEYGIADLRFKNRADRARQLIAIAHPKFRDELLEKAKLRKII